MGEGGGADVEAAQVGGVVLGVDEEQVDIRLGRDQPGVEVHVRAREDAGAAVVVDDVEERVGAEQVAELELRAPRLLDKVAHVRRGRLREEARERLVQRVEVACGAARGERTWPVRSHEMLAGSG
eukprot:2625466-Prymnesium_polylepis.1